MARVHRQESGQFAPKPPANGQLTMEETSAQRPEQSQGIWQGIPGQTGNFNLGLGMLFPGGGGAWNPMGFPGYGSLYTGTPTTYRWMLQHPILRLVRSIDVGVIGASLWEYEAADNKVPEEWIKLASRVFNRLRPSLLADYFVRGRDYGFAAGEICWEADSDGYYCISKVKPLLNELTRVLQDENGNFIGLQNHVSIGGSTFVELPAPFKAWKFTFDSEAGYHYGRSWLENVRATAWADWLDAAQQMQKLTGKISGIVSVIMSPAGTFPGPLDANNKPTQVSYRANAESTIQALANGAAGVWFPSLGLMPDAKGNIDAMKVLVELAGKSLTNIEVLDFSGQSAAISPLLDRMKHDEDLMFAGGLRSARTGLEGKHGTKAEAESHTDTGTLNAEVDDRDFASQAQPLLDALMVVNFGDKAKGRVILKCPSLVDRKMAVLKAVVLSLMNDPSIAHESARTIAMGMVFKSLGVPVNAGGDFDAERMSKEIESAKAPKPPKNVDPQGGKPTD